MYPKQVILQITWHADIEHRTFEIVSASVAETDGFVFAVAYCVDDPLHTVYTILAFPMEEGIGGRSMHQWNYVYFLGYYAKQASAEHNMRLTWWRKHMAERAEKNAMGGRGVVEPRW